MQKAPETNSPIEQMRESLTDYEKNVWQCVEEGIKKHPGDFYVVVITKNERLMQNVFRLYYFNRISCPTPDYDQTVYRYKRNSAELIFMWVIPSRDASIHLMQNASYVTPEEQGLLKYVDAFNSGALFKLSKELNGEKQESSELEK